MSFRSKALKQLYASGNPRRIRPDLIARIERILSLLDQASGLAELNAPGLALHPLKGNLEGRWAVSVNANWRIVFRFHDADTYDVDLIDYH